MILAVIISNYIKIHKRDLQNKYDYFGYDIDKFIEIGLKYLNCKINMKLPIFKI